MGRRKGGGVNCLGMGQWSTVQKFCVRKRTFVCSIDQGQIRPMPMGHTHVTHAYPYGLTNVFCLRRPKLRQHSIKNKGNRHDERWGKEIDQCLNKASSSSEWSSWVEYSRKLHLLPAVYCHSSLLTTQMVSSLEPEQGRVDYWHPKGGHHDLNQGVKLPCLNSQTYSSHSAHNFLIHSIGVSFSSSPSWTSNWSIFYEWTPCF